MSDFGVSLWHDVLDDVELVWQVQQKIEQKRGGQLVAPLPRGGIGTCGYLEDLSRDQLDGRRRSPADPGVRGAR